jgi:hypothetical protein
MTNSLSLPQSVNKWALPLFRYLLCEKWASLGIFSHLTLREKVFLYATARSLPRRNCVVEIGSYLGASSCFLAAGISKRDGRVYCIDTWSNDAMTEGPKDTYSAFLANTKPYRTTITPLRSRSENAASLVVEPIDLLFVDGDHSYEGVSGDLRSWLPKLNPNAWLLLHDYGWAEGVQRAIREMVAPVSATEPIVLPNLFAVQAIDRLASVSGEKA